MPKSTRVIPGTRKTVTAKYKNKIGGRKSGKSANCMSTSDLVAIAGDPKRARDKAKIAAVLATRGIR